MLFRSFEEKYAVSLIALAKEYKTKNLWQIYLRLSKEEQSDPKLIAALKMLDTNVNVNWPLSHYKSAVRYLQKDPEDIAATGGTNWQKYLPPRFQKRIFYPELFTQQELDEWGKAWVKREVFGI